MTEREQLADVVDAGIEVVPSHDINQAKMQAMISAADHLDRAEKALDKIRAFVLGRALPGDWLRFGDKLEMSGPGAERVISALAQMGIPVSFTNWSSHKDIGTDKNGSWFYWWYAADVEIGCFRGRIEGRAGSRDLFFGKENGAWKDVADVRETDIRMAARRGVFKEGIKTGMGLRGIPVDSAKALGLDPSKIKAVEFGKRGESAVTASAPGTVVKIVDVKAFSKKDETDAAGKVIKKGWTRFDVIDDKGAKYATFSETLADQARNLKGKHVKLTYEVGNRGNDLKKIAEATDAEAAQGQDGAAQEPLG